jgi:hypothetical protein
MQLQFVPQINTMKCEVKCINFQVMSYYKNIVKDNVYCEANVIISTDCSTGLRDVL